MIDLFIMLGPWPSHMATPELESSLNSPDRGFSQIIFKLGPTVKNYVTSFFLNMHITISLISRPCTELLT